MNILVDTVRIAGFRGIADLEISLPPVAVLIGPNNAGKTSLIKALQLALGDYARALSEEDFHIDVNQKRSEEILVDVRVVALDVNGTRTNEFNGAWQEEFGDKIQAEANGMQFLGIRTRVKPNSIKGGFEATRYTMANWPEKDSWSTAKIKESKLATRLDSLPFISIEAQRDIHQELKEKSSFVGRVLSNVEYNEVDIKGLEALIKDINDEAVGKSEALKNLKIHLEALNHSIDGAGSAEITPFPKRIRDLSKHFSVHFGENAANSFSMEYHGMGTRSWASMLTVKSFLELMIEKHAKESKPYFPILAAEEPEAHLHPNAQRTLYQQLATTKGQIILSTHSPYLAAMANPAELRSLTKIAGSVVVSQLSPGLAHEDLRRLQREVIHSRGEIFFSKALVLCEGETEEQALPLLFRKYFEHEAFQLGVNIIGVGGAGKYLPFFRFAKDFSLPVFVFSDGEEEIVKKLQKHFEAVFQAIDIKTCPQITILDGQDFEGYLISSGYQYVIEGVIEEVGGIGAIEKWIKKRDGSLYSPEKTDKPPCVTCKQSIFEGVARDYSGDAGRKRALADILDSGKTKYAPAIAAKLCELDLAKLPPKVIEIFEKIRAGVTL